MDDIVGVIFYFTPGLFGGVRELGRLSLRDLAIDIVSTLLHACLEVSPDGCKCFVKEGSCTCNHLFHIIRVVYLLFLNLGIVGLHQSTKFRNLHSLLWAHQPSSLTQYSI